LIVGLILFSGINVVSAKSNIGNQNTVRNENRESTPSGEQISNNLRNMEQLEAKIKNPQAREALNLTTQMLTQSEATVESSLNEMSGRPGFLKFIIGPDYKNAGQVRSEIVKLRNEIDKLIRSKEDLSTSDQAAIDESIDILQSNLDTIETRLGEALKGISLFGWLNRFLSGFVAPTATATPEATPLASPEASATPIE
jgi:hypothetical protein